MIIQSAIKLNGKVYTGHRHHNVLGDAIKHGLGFGGLKLGEQGFVDDKGNFLDREEAGRHAIACGQIKQLKYHIRDCFSEDLW